MPNITKKVCIHHGETDYILEGRGTYRCRKCRSENVSAYRIKRKLDLIEKAGGKCSVCGYNKCREALEFHHLDPSKKKFNVANGLTLKKTLLLEEAEKCVLVCANCHAEIEAGITPL